MNATTFSSRAESQSVPHPSVLSIDEAPVPLLLSRRDRVTAGFRREAEEKKASIHQNHDLSEGQRRHALEMLRQQTEAQMRCALGERNFHAFKAFNEWWFRELSTADRGQA
jgi:hypothetical protein